MESNVFLIQTLIAVFQIVFGPESIYRIEGFSMCAKPSPSQKQEVVPHMTWFWQNWGPSPVIYQGRFWHLGCPENVVDCPAFNEAHVQKLLHLHGPAIPEPWNHLQWLAVKCHWKVLNVERFSQCLSECIAWWPFILKRELFDLRVPNTCRSQHLPAFKDFFWSNWLQNSTMASCAWRGN